MRSHVALGYVSCDLLPSILPHILRGSDWHHVDCKLHVSDTRFPGISILVEHESRDTFLEARSRANDSLTICFAKEFLQHLRLDTDYHAHAAVPPDCLPTGLDACSGSSSASTVGSLAAQSRRTSLSSQSSGELPVYLGSNGSVRYITSVPALQDVS